MYIHGSEATENTCLIEYSMPATCRLYWRLDCCGSSLTNLLYSRPVARLLLPYLPSSTSLALILGRPTSPPLRLVSTISVASPKPRSSRYPRPRASPGHLTASIRRRRPHPRHGTTPQA